MQCAFGGSGNFSNGDAFVAKFTPNGRRLLYSTYLGGSEGESGLGIAADNRGNAYVTGYTQSRDFPTANALQPALGGSGFFPSLDAFVAKIGSPRKDDCEDEKHKH